MVLSIENALKSAFRPEFINRIDDIVVFEPLTEPEIAKIADLIIDQVKARLLERSVTFAISEIAKNELVREGYDPNFGARPLRRIVERRIENPLAKRVLSGEFLEGDQINVDYLDDNFTFTREPGEIDIESVEVEPIEI